MGGEESYEAVLDAVRESVKVMGTHADLYLLHWPVNPKQRIEYWRVRSRRRSGSGSCAASA